MRTPLLWLLLAPLAAQSIEQYLNLPFASALTVAPGGGRVAWVVKQQGANNIWVASAPDFNARRLTDFRSDDGRDIGDVAWSADGRTLVYVHGGDLDTGGDNPNPESLPQPPEQAIFAIAFDGGAPRRLAEGRSPAVSSNGKVAFLRSGQIWMTSLDAEKAVEVVRTKGRSQTLRWSPDGQQLAFANNRTDHSFIGVYNPAARTLRYLDASVDRDAFPVWAPDGQRIVFLRQPVWTRPGGAGPVREAPDPWSIRVADVATGKGKEIWRASQGRGSVYRAIVAADQLFWMDGGRIAFAWEKDGWTHLYSVLGTGGLPLLLTPGEFEVEHVAPTADRKALLYSSNQNDIDRRHVWRVAVTGGATAVTSGTGVEWMPVDVGSAGIAFLRSSAGEHPRAAFQPASGARKDFAAQPVEASVPFVTPEPVVFSAADGMKIHGQLFLPRGASGKRPAIIFFHGGSRRQMLLGWHYMYYYSNTYAMNQYLASRGYVVLSVNYRSGIGYGLDFREALNYGPTGASEYQDVTGAGLYMAARPDVDARRIGVYGGSYGGYLTALALARSSDLFAAGVDLHGVHDWSARGGSVANPALDPERQREQARIAFSSSPMASVHTWRSPVLLIHGDDDRNVNFSQTVKLVEALRARKVEMEQLIFPDDVHDFLLTRHWVEAMKAADDFFARKLKQ